MASRSWNRVELIGNLTRDPEVRYIPSGTAVATFGIATNRVYVSDGERKEEVDFHRIVAWGKLAELCSQLLKKGSRVFVSGRLQYREWETQDGQKKRDAEIVMEDMIQLTPKSGMYGGDEVEEAAEHKEAPVESAPAKSEEVVKPTEADAKEEEIKEEESAPKAPKVDEKLSDEDIKDLPF